MKQCKEKLPDLASRMEKIHPFHVMRVLKQAQDMEKTGREVIHMEVGEPDFTTPEPIIKAAQNALTNGYTKYTPAAGITELREAIARFYQERYGVSVSPERIIITPGATGALQLVLAALLNVGDEVLLPDPGYPCNRHYVELLNARPRPVPVSANHDYQPAHVDLVSRWNAATRVLMLASPANPTGTVLALHELEAYAELITKQNTLTRSKTHLVVDEIYHGLTYQDDSSSPLQTALSLSNTDNLFVVNSFSKYFGMTGWRLGWVVAPENYIEALDRLAQNLFLCAPTVSQYAALAAFKPESITIMEQRRQAFKQRRDLILPALREMGFDIPVTPEGAFYIYANCHALCHKAGMNSTQLAADILSKTGVAITPGLDFGDYLSDEFVRFAYTTNTANLDKAMHKLKNYFKQAGFLVAS